MFDSENQAYQNKILEAYQKISDTFDDFTQLMRKRVPYEQWPDHCKIKDMDIDSGEKHLFSHESPNSISIPDYTESPSSQLEDKIICQIKDLGRIQERLKMILDDEIFDKTSKHNPYWYSKYEEEEDKLDELRIKLSCLNDNLWDIMAILRKEE